MLVDLIVEELSGNGVAIIKKPEKAFWDGYSGYVADPDENLWEVGYHPYLPLDKNGEITERKN